MAVGGVYALWGGYSLAFLRFDGEKAAAEFRAVIESGGDPAHAFALADARLQYLVARERRGRWIRGILGGTLALASVPS